MDSKTIQRLRGWHFNEDTGYSRDMIDGLREWLETRANCDVLGSGAYGVVVDADLYVVKICDANDVGYIGWLNFCQLVGPNRFLPEIYYSQRISKTLHVVVMEKLETDEYNIENNPDYVAAETYSYVFPCIRREEAVAKADPELLAILDLMSEYQTAFNQAVDDMIMSGRNDQYLAMITNDIHTTNVMFRHDGQMVITDPWCS